MNTPVRFEDEADVEYREAGRWYNSRASGLGIEFFDEVDATIRRIVDFPDAGVPAPRLPSDLSVRRLAVKRFPYHVVYLRLSGELRILAIAHDRRKPGYWRGRLR